MYRPFQLLMALFWGFWFQSFLWGQSCELTLNVAVEDLHDGTPLSGARVELIEEKRVLVTDSLGMVVFLNLCKGPKTLLVEHEECTPQTQNFRIRKDQYVKVTLEHHINELQEIIVQEQAIRKGTEIVTEEIIEPFALFKYQSANLGDLLEGVSGVSSIRTGMHIAKPVLHGMSGSRLGIVQDGTRIRDQEWGSDHAPSIDSNSADRIRVVKGGAALRYGGDTAAGVIVMDRTPVPILDSLYGHVALDAQSNGQGGSAVGKLQLTKSTGVYAGIQWHYKDLGDLHAPDYNLSNTGTNKRTLSLHWGLQKINRKLEVRYRYLDETLGILRAAHLGNVNDLVRALNSDQPLVIRPFTRTIDPPKQSNYHQQAHLSYQFYSPQDYRWQWDYDFQLNRRREYDIRRDSEDKRPAIDMELTTHTFQGNFRNATNEIPLEVGVSGTFQRNFSDPTLGVRRLIPDYTQLQLGTYASFQYVSLNDFVWEGGLRYDFSHLDAKKYYKRNRWERLGYDQRFEDLVIRNIGSQVLVHIRPEFHMFSFTLGMKRALSEQLEFRVHYALTDRPPNAGELFSDGLHHSLAVIQYGDMELTNERVHKLHVNLSRQHSNFSWEIEAYAGRSANYIIEEPTELETISRGPFPTWQFRAVAAQLWGIDLDAQWTPSDRFQWTGQAAYVYGQNTTEDIPLVDMPPLQLQQNLRWFPLQNQKLSFGLNHDFVAKQFRAPKLIVPYNLIENGEIVSGTIDLGAPENVYHLWGIEASWETQLFGQKTQFILQGRNLMDTDYRNYLNRMRYFAAEMGRNLQLQIRMDF